MEQITNEMKEWFTTRTNNHIELVRKYCLKICKVEKYKKTFGYNLIIRGANHDQSKFQNPEFQPYVLLTWRYKNPGLEFSKDTCDEIDRATFEHIKTNKHHPEYHDSQVIKNSINKEDRDKPSGVIINAEKMGDVDIAEMVADWCAISEEKKGHPMKWYNDNKDVRWKFSNTQDKLIKDIIENVWKEENNE